MGCQGLNPCYLQCLLSITFLFPYLGQFASALVFNSTALVLGTSVDDASQCSFIFDSYGIPWEEHIIPDTGGLLPALETDAGGNYGLFLIPAQAVVNVSSVLTTDQWNSLYAYQEKYGVRMVHVDALAGPDFGVTQVGSCCYPTVEQWAQLIPDAATKMFPNTGLRAANLSTQGLFHTPAAIATANQSTTTAFVNFLPNANLTNTTVAAVINTFPSGREQMAFFLDSGNWSTTTTYLNHLFVHWGYRGAYQGYRRVHVNTQVDDLFLSTTTYKSSRAFRVRPEDFSHMIDWSADLNVQLNQTNPGSKYFSEYGFNANGNLAYSFGVAQEKGMTCAGPLFTAWSEPDIGLEYMKPLGTGKNSWPQNPTFDWTGQCVYLDPLTQFFTNLTARDAIGLVSHTFTHLDLDRATYHDVLREISFNLLFAELVNFTNAAHFSGSGLIPPAITGMHNGDALRAFSDNGLWNVIGDNTRPVLRSNQNRHWPRITDTPNNGYGGYQITPRFATRIYYNCDTVECDVQQCYDTADCPKDQGMYGLLELERKDSGNQVFQMLHDPYMFHQPNLRQTDVEAYTIDNSTQQYSLLGMWVKTITDELARLCDWPLISLRHDHIAESFNRRMTRDACAPVVQYNISNKTLTSVTIRASGGQVTDSQLGNVTVTTKPDLLNTCTVEIPITFPRGSNVTGTIPSQVSNNATLYVDQTVILAGVGFHTTQIGNDPLTVWVRLAGEPVTLNLKEPIAWT